MPPALWLASGRSADAPCAAAPARPKSAACGWNSEYPFRATRLAPDRAAAPRARETDRPETPAYPHRPPRRHVRAGRSEEHTSELQSLIRISYAVFCLIKKPQVRTPDREE